MFNIDIAGWYRDTRYLFRKVPSQIQDEYQSVNEVVQVAAVCRRLAMLPEIR